ncbi:MAG: circularly permuted type 2 ATP-grasp protein [bacterium]|nr:circularly permuted type 2 ATP-grasp protein [bacterium]
MPDKRIAAMEALDDCCRVISIDRPKLRELLDREHPELSASIEEQQPNMFAAGPIYVPRSYLEAMAKIVSAAETVAGTAAYQDEVMRRAPSICSVDHGPTGVFFGYDFHLGDTGPQLIEINTNAGGAFLNTALARAQQTCCAEIDAFISPPHEVARLESVFLDMFRAEWEAQRGDTPLRRVAIVDDEPKEQFMYPEFQIARELFTRAGIEAVIADPGELQFEDSRVTVDGRPVDMIYMRHCDFYLEHHERLRRAYANGAVVLTPNPHAYGLLADKRNLVILSDPGRLRALGADPAAVEVLAAGVPKTENVTREAADDLWSRRKQLFFKPATGYGSRATYRGAKLTRKTWGAILESPYVAQALVPPSERKLVIEGEERPLKLDLRAFVFRAQIQLFAARLYRGQTTNFRTTGGGFAPVYSDRS